MKGYKTTMMALHCSAAVCAIIVIGITGDSLASLNKVARLANQALQESKQYLEGMGIGASDLMQEAGAVGNMPGKAPMDFLIFVAIVGLLLNGFMLALQLLPRAYEATLGALLKTKTAAWVQRPFLELLLSVLWSIMWMAGAAAASHLLEGSSDCAGYKLCDLANALLAFSWLSWLLWCAATALLGWTWGKGLSAASHGTGSGAAAATELPTVAPVAAAAAAPINGKVVEGAAPAGVYTL